MHLFYEIFGPYSAELIDLLRFIAFIGVIGLAFWVLDKLEIL